MGRTVPASIRLPVSLHPLYYCARWNPRPVPGSLASGAAIATLRTPAALKLLSRRAIHLAGIHIAPWLLLSPAHSHVCLFRRVAGYGLEQAAADHSPISRSDTRTHHFARPGSVASFDSLLQLAVYFSQPTFHFPSLDCDSASGSKVRNWTKLALCIRLPPGLFALWRQHIPEHLHYWVRRHFRVLPK